MNKNSKAWVNDEKVISISTDADLENTTKKSLQLNVDDFKELKKVNIEINTIEMVLDLFETHKSNNLDVMNSEDLKRAGQWLRTKLQHLGYDL